MLQILFMSCILLLTKGDDMRLFITAILFLVVLLVALPSFAFDNGDFQYWNSENVELKLKDGVTLDLQEEFRFGGNAGTFYYNHTDLGIKCIVTDYFEFSANYRHVFNIKDDDWDSLYEWVLELGSLRLPWMLIWGAIISGFGWYGWAGALILIPAIMLLFFGPQEYEWKT